MHFHTQLDSHQLALSCLSHTDGSSAAHIPSHSHLTGEVDARDPRANSLMAPSFPDAWKTAIEAEKELLQCFSQERRTFDEFEHFLSEFRISSQNAILLDFGASREVDVESRLWDAHLKVNNRFRKQLLRFREEHGKKKPVERRKLERHYLDFIKSSQRFYRGYIQHLSSRFGGIVELERVARKFNFESLSGQPPIKPSNNLRRLILQSCHATLIRLGDLSRYRESELVSKDRNWGPAIGYYDLASVINPASGASQNQLAIIALADGNHLRATYHLYRALSAQEPHPTAKGNLEIELRKIMSAWAKRELIRPEDAGIPGRALTPWFLYLHAKCYKGTDFPEHDELESEVLSQLAVEIRERSLEGTLQKFCLINIAAEDFAKVRSVEESVVDARVFFQRINVKTFFTLLQILLVELERTASFEDPNSKDALPIPDKVSVVARRILPALRHYSSWLLTNSQSLVEQKEEKDSALSIQIKEFWKIYAGTLSLLASSFDVVSLPEVDYLLEEDEESLGFAPLDQDATSRRYGRGGDQSKPRMHDLGIERSHPNMEMLYRIREFVIDGLDLVVRGKIPVALVDSEDKKTFIYQEEDLPSQFYSSPHCRQHALSAASIEREDIPQASQNPYSAAEAQSLFGGSQSASASMSANMHQIVEGVERLVDSDTYETPPNDQFAFMNTGEISTPTHVSPNVNAYPFRDENSPPLTTPIAPPPGLGPPGMNAADPLRAPSAQSYTSRPAIPSLPSIWTPLRDTAPPRTPPGLGPQPGQQAPLHHLASGNVMASERSPSQDQLANELMLRQHLMAQTQFSNSLDVGSMPTPWASSNMSHARPTASGWDHGRATFGAFELPSQATPSSLGHPSWANDAFIASSLAGATPYNSGIGGRKPGTQLGAIGQTPPCGQGG
ncbi:DNA/RNA-binding domain E.t1.c1-type [Penicillium cf. griseofulvum]|uniref:Nonsense-mediated mRNA decay factor n=1 Tax=Penicillium cf. griseofulvum TaxID=2972120 RepID=A0A9W9IMX1_9EURO|nr:DNA/RNA-binding domain E.t1.c1-type [Penicillium cf. griseofulvum]KAJ5442787.1 DNA/RNA-binding domain E.t1.c1-type [Penicillium cf. griseofulvum]KAJ5451441.1 DNA/RNA-binding domain E.t1.c1-type [Penicillium cf. griseofulvum]